MHESPNIAKRDIDQERARLKAAMEKYPVLKTLLDELPADYDPDEPVEERADV